MLDRLTAADFRPLLGQAFAADGPLILVDVTDSRAVPPAGFRRAFSLVFEGEAGQAMQPQGIRAVEHPALGRLEIFLVPIAPTPAGVFRYEAVFG